MSLAPDGLGILLEQSVAATVNSGNTANLPKTRDGRMITDSQLWFLPIVRDEDGTILAADPEPLAIAGVHPQWLP
jgi:hypothetical protein